MTNLALARVYGGACDAKASDFVTAFLPCRAGSQRVREKNTRSFASFSYGLLELKLQQLLQSKAIDSILVSTNDENVIDFVNSYLTRYPSGKVVLDIRPDSLCTDDCLQALIEYVPTIVTHGHVLWTHVTSPFFGSQDYDDFVECYFYCLASTHYDSVIAADILQTFVYQNDHFISHDAKQHAWPRTQDINPMYAINSAGFMIASSLMKQLKNRIGLTPTFFKTPLLHGFDIDSKQDFELAQKLWPVMC